MDRRGFLAAGLGGAIAGPAGLGEWTGSAGHAQDDVRALFPRLAGGQTFLNTAGGAPLSTFAETGLERYMAFQRLGPGDGREEYLAEMWANIRGRFGALIGARASEIALVHCTKAGEQIALDALLRPGRSVVTNDLHFSGSLHNLVGMKRAGADVRIVRARDWTVSVDEMASAIDDTTALVAVTLVSNVNGHIESIRELADVAHAHGALVYADIIQAAGIVPVDVREMGIDIAAGNAYKWLWGVHGAGVLFVAEEHQGTRLPDRLFPGRVRFNYPPWTDAADPSREPLVYEAPADARRYEPGHVSYLAYCAVYEGLEFVQRTGVERMLAHSVRLNQRLDAQVDHDRFESISPHTDRSPIVAYRVRDAAGLEGRLRAANVVVSLGSGRIRVSPAIFNTEQDVERLAEALHG